MAKKDVIEQAMNGVDLVHVMLPFALGTAAVKMAKKKGFGKFALGALVGVAAAINGAIIVGKKNEKNIKKEHTKKR